MEQKKCSVCGDTDGLPCSLPGCNFTLAQPHPIAAQSAPDEREAFEVKYPAAKGLGFEDGKYIIRRESRWLLDACRVINTAWGDWQAGAAWQRAQSAPVVPEERDNPENMDGLVRKYARHAAWVFGKAQGLKYTPKNAAEAENFEPHGWVVHAIWSAFEDGKAYQAGRVNGRMRDYGIVLAAPQPAARQEQGDDFTPAEILASRLIDAWCAAHGKPVPWAKAVQITGIVTKQPQEEIDRLLAMDDSPQHGDELLAGAQAFKDELLKASRAMLHPHIEGVFAVFQQQRAALSAQQGAGEQA